MASLPLNRDVVASIGHCIPNISVQNGLGKGNFGVVHKAQLWHQGRMLTVAIKSYDIKQLNGTLSVAAIAKLLQKLDEEIKSLEDLTSESILKLYGHYEDTRNQYRHLVLDFCEGGDLEQQLVNKQSPFSESQVKEWCHQLLDGLIEMETKNIVHRDIKPANIFLKNQKAILGDFGLVKHDLKKSTTTVAGSGVFMAPEVGGRVGHNCKADVWSLGVTLYMLLFGKDPWDTWDGLKNQAGMSPWNNYNPKTCGDNLIFPYHIPVSEDFKRIIRRMITWDQNLRISCIEIICDPYFEGPSAKLRYPEYGVVQPVQAGSPRGIKTMIIDSTIQPGPGPHPQSPQPQYAGQNAYQPAPYPPHNGGYHHTPAPYQTPQYGYGQPQQVVHHYPVPQPQPGPWFGANPTPFQPHGGFGTPQPVKQNQGTTAEQYFIYLNNCGKFFQETGKALRYCSSKPDVYHDDMWQHLGALGAVVNKINIELLQLALEQLDSQQQPPGIGTAFEPFYRAGAGVGMYKTKFAERLADVQGLQRDALDWLQTSCKLPVQSVLVQLLAAGPAFTTSKPANQIANKVAHVLCETAMKLYKQQALRDDTFFQVKQGLCRVYLCLTYQQAMEFRDQAKDPLDWRLFLERLQNPKDIDIIYNASVQHFMTESKS